MRRRSFLISMGRLTIFGALAVVSALAIRRVGHTENGSCTVNRFCRNCGLLEGCDLPEALSEKYDDLKLNS